MITGTEADRLVALPKTIGDRIRWQTPIGRSGPRYRFEVAVVCPDPDPPMRLTGAIGVTNWSYVLLSKRVNADPQTDEAWIRSYESRWQ